MSPPERQSRPVVNRAANVETEAQERHNQHTPLMNAAVELARNGWAVFPLNGKVPAIKDGRAHLDATTDQAQIIEWWTTYPTANIGTAVPQHLIVIDVDPRNGGNVDDLGTLPPTWTVWSGRNDGGHHLYFRRPPGELTSTRLPAGIDLKANGYVVLPPSIHPVSNLPYRWDNLDHLPPHPPIHIKEMLRVKRRFARPGVISTVGSGDTARLLTWVANQQKKNRNNGLFWAACRLAEAGELKQHGEALVAAGESAGLSEREARRTVASAAGRVT